MCLIYIHLPDLNHLLLWGLSVSETAELGMDARTFLAPVHVLVLGN